MMLKLSIFLVAIAAATTVYIVWIRPILMGLPQIKGLVEEADGFWEKLWAQLRTKWDLVVSALLIAGPDVIDLLSQIQGIGLDGLVPSETANIINKVLGITLIVGRAVVLRKTT